MPASPKNLSTLPSRSRRQVALRLLRLRQASGLTQPAAGKLAGVSKRAVCGLEAAEHRMTALELFLALLDRVVAEQGVEAALEAILLPRYAEPRIESEKEAA